MTIGELRERLAEVSDACEIRFVMAGSRQEDFTKLWSVRHYPMTQEGKGLFLFDLQIVSEGYPKKGATCYAQVELLAPMGYAESESRYKADG